MTQGDSSYLKCFEIFAIVIVLIWLCLIKIITYGVWNVQLVPSRGQNHGIFCYYIQLLKVVHNTTYLTYMAPVSHNWNNAALFWSGITDYINPIFFFPLSTHVVIQPTPNKWLVQYCPPKLNVSWSWFLLLLRLHVIHMTPIKSGSFTLLKCARSQEGVPSQQMNFGLKSNKMNLLHISIDMALKT